MLPVWMPLAAVFGLWMLSRDVAARDRHACPICTYGLTGNESGICPECGTRTGSDTGLYQVNYRQILAFTCIHIPVFAIVLWLVMPREDDGLRIVATWIASVVLVCAPAFGRSYARMYVKWMNRRAAKQESCRAA
jgi:hypothetical protein